MYTTLGSMEREIADLFARRKKLGDSEWRQLNDLASLHRNLAISGSYRSFFVSGLSLLVPLIGPIIPLFKWLFGSS
jgi:hypothetical protein